MLSRLFAKTLTLKIAGQEISFSTLAEFEFALAGRTNVPTKKIALLVELSPADLKAEAKSIKTVEQSFVKILSKSIESPGSISKLLRGIDNHIFSQDHSWRDIIQALNDKDDDYDELRRIAVVKYMQYLSARQDVIKQTYRVKKRLPKIVPDSSSENAENEAEDAKKADFKDTVIFDSALTDDQPAESRAFSRIPKGEIITVQLDKGAEIEVHLSKHKFRFVYGNPSEFIDSHNKAQQLIAGKNIVGRDNVCNIVIDNAYRDVSRLQLIIEPLDNGQIRFTDLSSHGCFLPAKHIDGDDGPKEIV